MGEWGRRRVGGGDIPEFRLLWYLMEISLPRLSWMGMGPAVHSTSTESTPFHARMVMVRKGSNSCIRNDHFHCSSFNAPKLVNHCRGHAIGKNRHIQCQFLSDPGHTVPKHQGQLVATPLRKTSTKRKRGHGIRAITQHGPTYPLSSCSRYKAVMSKPGNAVAP